MLSKWHVTGLESGKVFNRLQKYIFRTAENQGQFLKLIQNVTKMSCDWNRNKKVFKSLQTCIIRIAKKQEQF